MAEFPPLPIELPSVEDVGGDWEELSVAVVAALGGVPFHEEGWHVFREQSVSRAARGSPAPQVFASSGVCFRESERLDGWEPQPNRRGLTAARTPFA
jgi:hypothetical protein